MRKHFNLLRRLNNFTPGTKRTRFQEEHGICQHCHQLIGDGTRWHDRGPGAAVAYHHIKMVCEGGDGSPQNCMVLHKECHAPGGQPNPELHGGRKWKYQTMAHYLNKPKCVWCDERRKLSHLHICRECSGVRIFHAHPRVTGLSPQQRAAQRDVCVCGRGKFRVDPECPYCSGRPRPDPTAVNPIRRARLEARMYLAELARRLGLHITTVRDTEQDDAAPTQATIDRYLQAITGQVPTPGPRGLERDTAHARREQIKGLRHLHINALARLFNVYPSIIRNDLKVLGITVAVHPITAGKQHAALIAQRRAQVS